jgi:hypothetical protein
VEGTQPAIRSVTEALDAAAYRRGVRARQLALLRHLGLAPAPGAALKARV